MLARAEPGRRKFRFIGIDAKSLCLLVFTKSDYVSVAVDRLEISIRRQ